MEEMSIYGVRLILTSRPLCSLWPFSAFSVLNSDKLNTEDTENHRGPQRTGAAIKNVRKVQIFRRFTVQSRKYSAPVAV
jgi:hypothetical protein